MGFEEFIKFFCVFCGLFPSNCQCFQMLAQCPAIIRAESCTHDDLHFLDAFLETFVIDDDCACQHVTVSSKKFCGAVDDDISTKAERVLSKGRSEERRVGKECRGRGWAWAR